MKEKIQELRARAEQAVKSAVELKEIDDLKVKFLGKKGELTDLMKGMKDLSEQERPEFGKVVNEVRDYLTSFIEAKFNEIKEKEKAKRIEKEFIDITLPGKGNDFGRFHPITETFDVMQKIFIDMGFDLAVGPEVEFVDYCFDKLNIPENHPSRDLQDTFYVSDDVALRPHTSPVQIRYMLESKPPFRMICPGKVYRSDYDISHSPMFHQMEGLMVGEDISFANLKGILTEFVHKVFGENRNVRFRPHFFPFTEPSAEMDVECGVCGGKGCRSCKGTGWLEIMGCGMVNPNVLRDVGLNPDEVSGFAFGMGVERITMLRHGIDDLRAFYENDMRFLRLFR